MKRSALAFVLLAGALAAADYAAEGNRWWSHVLYLADDKLEGRDTGTPGHRKAAEYVAAQFERAGLKPAGTHAYFQPVHLVSRSIDEPHSSLELLTQTGPVGLKLGEDALISMRGEPAAHTEAEAVFVGYGMTIPELHYDDLRGIDLRGKIAVYFYAAPKSVPGPLAAHMASERWKTLRAAGAIGMASFPDPKHMDVPWSRVALARFNPSVSFKDEQLNDKVAGLKLAVTINPEHADQWLEGTGHTAAELISIRESGAPMPTFPLKVKVRAKVAEVTRSLISDNVAAILPGSDPVLKNEYVVVSAHVDHVGVGRPINGDKIYNGAMDNASGTATIVEVARMMAAEPTHPKRSILFVVVTGEEKGLLGSQFFAAHPTVKQQQIIADLNVDMFLPLFPLKSLTVFGLEESDLGDLSRVVAQEEGIGIAPDREPERNLFVRSDQYNFIREGIPALSFKFDAEPGSAEDKILKTWLTERYHGPADDTAQPVDKQAAAKFNDYIRALTEQVANREQRPQWKQSSFFRRFAKGS